MFRNPFSSTTTGDENPIRTLGDYSKPSHEGYSNTIELLVGNNVDPNQHLKDFLKLVDSLDLEGGNRERMRLRLFQFSLRDQASNWLERLPAGSITTWEDLTTRFLAQYFPPGRIAKLRNDFLMFQQHHGEYLSEAWTRFKDLLQKFPHHGIDLWLQVQIFYDHVNPVTRQTIDQSVDGKLRDRNNKESWALLEDLALYDNESWNDPRDFAKPVKAIIGSRCPDGPHDTQYCMEDPKQAFVEYASSRTAEARDARLSKFEADFKQQQSEMTNKIDTVLKAITDRIASTLPSNTIKNPKLEIKEEEDNPENIYVNPPTPPDPSVTFITEKVLKFSSFFESLGLVPPLSNTKLIFTKEEDGDVMFIEIVPKDDNSCKEKPEAGEQEVEYFDIFPTRSELAYHKYLMCGPIFSIFLRNPIIIEGYPSNLKIPCNIGHIMRRKLNPRENANGGVSNFIRRIKGMHVFVGNFTYIMDFMIIEDISSIIDSRLSQVVLGKPFVEISNMTHDPSEGVVKFTNRNNEVIFDEKKLGSS
ncbi:MAK10-like protein [Tanacetum coccineum]